MFTDISKDELNRLASVEFEQIAEIYERSQSREYKILFLDLDGTVRRSKSGATFINDPHDQELMPGVLEAIARYDLEEWKVIGITNQGGVGAGYKTLENCILEQEVTMKIAPFLSSIYFCPDNGERCFGIHREGEDTFDWWEVKESDSDLKGTFRKPDIGMICISERDYERPGKLMVGDRPEDEECAKKAEIPFLWAHEWLEGKQVIENNPEPKAKSEPVSSEKFR